MLKIISHGRYLKLKNLEGSWVYPVDNFETLAKDTGIVIYEPRGYKKINDKLSQIEITIKIDKSDLNNNKYTDFKWI
tara:strand:- start:251 stop:481 length:231 start_codon:yes stop_codon:yes gene_type:complete